MVPVCLHMYPSAEAVVQADVKECSPDANVFFSPYVCVTPWPSGQRAAIFLRRLKKEVKNVLQINGETGIGREF